MAILFYIFPATLILLAGFFLAVHLIIKKADTKELQSEFEDALEESGYFEGISESINAIFGEGHTSRVVSATKEEALAFSQAENYADLLCKHFNLTINHKTLTQLSICYRWIMVLDQICEEYPEFENLRVKTVPTFFVMYVSKNCKNFAVGKFEFSKEKIEALYKEIWVMLYGEAKDAE